MFHVSRTLKNGATANDRLVLSTAAANGAPVNPGNPLTPATVPMVPRGVWQNIDAIVHTAAGNFHLGFWWWYESAQTWVLDTSIAGNGGAGVPAGYFQVDHSDGYIRIPIINNDTAICADGLYIEVNTLNLGAAPQVWLQGQQ